MRKTLARDWAGKVAGRVLRLGLGLLAGLALLTTTAASGTPPAATFSAAVNYTVGVNPHGVAVGDFNNDGNLDLAVANENSSPPSVSILLGDGKGGFAAAPGSPFSVAPGSGPIAIAVGHFTSSGNLDIVTANQGSGDVSILLGDGRGGFAPAPGSPVSVGLSTFPNLSGLAVGDFNGDGKLDLAVTNLDFFNSIVVILLGKGDGTFQAPVPFSTVSSLTGAGLLPAAVVAADFGNGKLDLATANQDGTVSILLGNGDGTFGAASSVNVGTMPSALAAGDFNGDKNVDLLVADSSLNNVSVLLGDGKGGFTPASGSPISVGISPSAIVVGDFNGDGLLDFVTANVGDNDASLVLGNGDGTFQPAVSLATHLNPVAVVAGDFNGDQKLDLALANESSGDVSVLLNITVAAAPPISVSVAPPTASVAGNSTAQFTATVTNDSANKGVAWTLTQSGIACSPACGSVSPASTASGVATTYTAPSSVPSPATVTLTASSVSDSTKSASATITVTAAPPPISVSVAPSAASVQVNNTAQFTATVTNDSANKGVSWALTQSGIACSPSCGSVSPASTASGVATTYMAPSSVPGPATVTLTAGSVSDSTKSASATITVTPPPNTPPTASAGPNQTIECAGPSGAFATLSGSGADTDGDTLSFTWLDEHGNVLSGVTVVNNVATVMVLVPLGTHTFTLLVNDGHGYIKSATTQVTVQDTTPPSMLSIVLTPSVLWPPDNKLVPITAQVQASDSCDPHPNVMLVSIWSTDRDDDKSDILKPDIVIRGASFWLRASKGDDWRDRVYTVTYQAMDAAGNRSAKASATVTVPHSQAFRGAGKKYGKRRRDNKNRD